MDVLRNTEESVNTSTDSDNWPSSLIELGQNAEQAKLLKEKTWLPMAVFASKQKKKKLPKMFLFFFIRDSNRERRRTNADLENKIRERRLPNVSPLGLHQWNKIKRGRKNEKCFFRSRSPFPVNCW